LKIADDEFGILPLSNCFGNLTRWRYCKRRSEDETQIGLFGVIVGPFKRLSGEKLPEVNDSIKQDSATDCTFSPCAMIGDSLFVGSYSSEI
jgi:hypothetical protein